MNGESLARQSARLLWERLGGAPAGLLALTIEGDQDQPREQASEALPSRFAVGPFAAASVGIATLAAAELFAERTGRALPAVSVDALGAAAIFRSEAHFAPIGWQVPAPWDPLAGDYAARDGFVRLHTNYAHHRRAALTALGLPEDADRAAITALVSGRPAEEVEIAVVEAGGCAARLLTREAWLETAHGRATKAEPPVSVRMLDPRTQAQTQPLPRLQAAITRPLEGLRVLDLTRVLAGPACTRFLAAHGARVLRLDPPGFEEVAALLPDMTVGKRCAALDLRSSEGRARFLSLLAQADVLVSGYRPGALEGLGLDEATLRAVRPELVHARLSAYGFVGPWSGRRGFDSLVQMSVGIAAPPDAGAKPSPLPAQALDHGLGYLAAAAVCRALVERVRSGRGATVQGSLLGVANHLFALPRPTPAQANGAPTALPEHAWEEVETHWGRARRIRCPGTIAGAAAPRWQVPAGPLGTTSPAFE